MYEKMGNMAELQMEFENSEYRCVEEFLRNYNTDKEKQQKEIKRRKRFNLARHLIKRLLKHKLNK
jgi:hypothetical protein